jgi:hypothetical protein
MTVWKWRYRLLLQKRYVQVHILSSITDSTLIPLHYSVNLYYTTTIAKHSKIKHLAEKIVLYDLWPKHVCIPSSAAHNTYLSRSLVRRSISTSPSTTPASSTTSVSWSDTTLMQAPDGKACSGWRRVRLEARARWQKSEACCMWYVIVSYYHK